MFEELELIRSAAQVLAVRDPTLTERLLNACDTMWEQMYEKSDWPADLEKRALALMQRLLAEGSLEATLDGLDDSEAGAVAHEIIEFAKEIDARNGAPVGR